MNELLDEMLGVKGCGLYMTGIMQEKRLPERAFM
jgi:hypothetical protein